MMTPNELRERVKFIRTSIKNDPDLQLSDGWALTIAELCEQVADLRDGMELLRIDYNCRCEESNRELRAQKAAELPGFLDALNQAGGLKDFDPLLEIQRAASKAMADQTDKDMTRIVESRELL